VGLQEERFHEVDGGAGGAALARPGPSHGVGQLGERLDHRCRHRSIGEDRQAHLDGGPVAEAPQRRGDVGVGGGHGGVALGIGVVGNGLAGHQREVAGAPQAAGGQRQQGGLIGVGAVEAPHHGGVAGVIGPGHAEGLGGAPDVLDDPSVRGRQGAQQADAGGQHGVGRHHPGEERDLGVPAHGGDGHLPLEAVALTVQHDPLGRQVEAHAIARRLDLLAHPAHLGQQGERPVGVSLSPVELLLDLGVGELGPAPHHGALEVGGRHCAVAVEVDGPQDGGPVLVGQQAG
jgi:hypothetical protein